MDVRSSGLVVGWKRLVVLVCCGSLRKGVKISDGSKWVGRLN